MRHRSQRVGPIAIALGLLSGALLHADTLVLRDGTQVNGRLIEIRNNTIEFEPNRRGQSTMRVNRRDVRRIEFDTDGGGYEGGFDRPGRPGGDYGGGRPGGGDYGGQREREVNVPARESWYDTGIELRSGQTVRFQASGRVRWGPGRQDEPDGENNSPHNPNRPIPSRPAAALVGRIGDDSPFFIGKDSSPIRARSSGRLYLMINDDVLEDNTGSFRVIVYY
jgi:hypothetical protein